MRPEKVRVQERLNDEINSLGKNEILSFEELVHQAYGFGLLVLQGNNVVVAKPTTLYQRFVKNRKNTLKIFNGYFGVFVTCLVLGLTIGPLLHGLKVFFWSNFNSFTSYFSLGLIWSMLISAFALPLVSYFLLGFFSLAEGLVVPIYARKFNPIFKPANCCASIRLLKYPELTKKTLKENRSFSV